VISASYVASNDNDCLDDGEFLGPYGDEYITLMMDVISISETSVSFYGTARRNIQEDSHLHVNYE
jgi:hypothetical protein